MKGDKLLIIPIELFQREIYTGLYLGLTLVNEGFDVLICDQLNPILDNVEGGVAFHKDHAKWSVSFLKKFRSRNVKLVVHDTEGLIVINPKRYRDGRVSSEAIRIVDAVLCWGNTQRNIMKEVVNDKFHLAGDLRFDIARRKKANIPLPKTISKVLINTRFSYVNSIQKIDIVDSFRKLGYLQDEHEIIKFREIVKNDEVIFNEFIECVKELVKADIEVIIRPHPAEDHETYKLLFGGQVLIDAKSPLNSQIEWADCVVHDGCTTAIEAKAQGKYVFGLRPLLEGEVYDDYANKFSDINFKTGKDLVEYLLKFDLRSAQLEHSDSINVAEDIYNFNGDKPYFVDTFIDVVNEFNLRSYQIKKKLNYSYFKKFIKYSLYYLIKLFRIKFFNKTRMVDGIEKYEKKFGKVSLNQVSSICRDIEGNILQNKVDYEVVSVNAKAFMLKHQSRF